MAEKYWTEGGDRGFNNSSTGLGLPSRNYEANVIKNISNSIYKLYEEKIESIDYFLSCCPTQIPIEYKERSDKIVHYIH